MSFQTLILVQVLHLFINLFVFTGYLQRTREKYAAAECISNKSYILSHNKNNLVKLWELTGEFISAQKLDGRIVCVCPETLDSCFLAVLETVSEVGQKFASVSVECENLGYKSL